MKTNGTYPSFEWDAFDKSTQRVVHNLEITITTAVQIVCSIRIPLLQPQNDPMGVG